VRRILGLGLATLDSLPIGELKAILAHEYAHFSHRDTAYGCFIDRAMRDKFYRSILDQKRSLFDSHPSFRERVDAVSGFPDQPQREQTPAIELFDDREALEQAMTDALTGQVQQARRTAALQAARAQARR
jgi:hypothetical protein